MNNKHLKRGFTLIELLVVVLIIGILTAVALPQYQKAVAKARVTEIINMRNIAAKGFTMYVLSGGSAANSDGSILNLIGDSPHYEFEVSFPWKECTEEFCNSGHFWYGATDEGGSYGEFYVKSDLSMSTGIYYTDVFNYTTNAFDSNGYCHFIDAQGKIYCDALKGLLPDLTIGEW